ncbi:MAG: acyl-CoA dehydrogenase family protein [Deltaproteobacteria bacterium]|nr:acyl-CoA dehydrogenase family protein [Deltaproteobacteria bacterium]
MDLEMFSMVLETLRKIERDRLSLETRLEMDKEGDFPEELIRFMLGPDVGLHLIFIPEEYGGLGASAVQIARISEEMAKIDMAIATSFLAICLGMDPIRVAGTEEQKEKYIRRIAEEGLIVGYGITEPEAGSNVQALKTKAERVLDDKGNIKGYKMNGQKQFITNGGVADLFTILADTPDGPSFFIVEKGAAGLSAGKHEDKHGIRASNTASLTLEDVYVPAEDLVGGAEGLGLKQANRVFGYTRLMVATFGLAAGMASLEKVVSYAKERVQFGSPLMEKQGYTHKLMVPHAVRLEAARACIEEVAGRIDAGEEDLQVEGSIAKYFATEVGDAMANDGIQALGGYGYMREYEVEKIKRDVKITTIFEGTSEIQQSIISIFRLRETLHTKGGCYGSMSEELANLPYESGGPMASRAVQLLNELLRVARTFKVTKSQHLMFLLADMMTWVEVAKAICVKACSGTWEKSVSNEYMLAVARLFARETVEKVYLNSLKILNTGQQIPERISERLNSLTMTKVHEGALADMDLVAKKLKS